MQRPDFVLKLPPRPTKLLPGVTFATSCYEKDWHFLLPNSRLHAMLENLNYDFVSTLLVLNHHSQHPQMEKAVEPYLKQGLVAQCLRSQDYGAALLDYFEISEAHLYPGYYYLIQNLAALYFCPTQYLLWMTCDSLMANAVPWIQDSLVCLSQEPQWVVANPSWSFNPQEIRAEAIAQHQDYFVGYGFSDQCFLIAVENFLKPIYEYRHPASERYPKGGGWAFEMRVDAWMRSENYLRLTHKEAVYLHRNFA